MKPHPHIRKAVKWGGAAVTGLLVIAWVGSGWKPVGCASPLWTAVVDHSGYWFFGDPIQFPAYVQGPFDLVHQVNMQQAWWFSSSHSNSGLSIFLPHWALCVSALLVTAVAWRLDTAARRRARLILCPKCHYDRAGLAAGVVCPECGAAAV